MLEADLVITSKFEKNLILSHRKKLKTGKLLKCPNKKCNHIWVYKGKSSKYTSCPKCLHGAVHVEKHIAKGDNWG